MKPPLGGISSCNTSLHDVIRYRHARFADRCLVNDVTQHFFATTKTSQPAVACACTNKTREAFLRTVPTFNPSDLTCKHDNSALHITPAYVFKSCHRDFYVFSELKIQMS